MSSTLSVWLVVLLSGCVILFFVGFLNPYIPSIYKINAKRYRNGEIKEPPVVEVEFHFKRMIYLVIAIVVTLGVMVLFLFEDFFPMVQWFGAEKIFSYLLAVVVVVFAAYWVCVFLVTVILFGENISLDDKNRRYLKYYKVDIMVRRR